MVSDIHWGLGTDPLWIGGLVFAWQSMAAEPPHALWATSSCFLVVGRWAGRMEDGHRGRSSAGSPVSAPAGSWLQSVDKETQPPQQETFPMCTASDGSALHMGKPTQLPSTHSTRCTLIWVLFGGWGLFACLVGLGFCLFLVFCFVLYFPLNSSLFSTGMVWGTMWGTILLSCPLWYIWGHWEKPGPRGKCF